MFCSKRFISQHEIPWTAGEDGVLPMDTKEMKRQKNLILCIVAMFWFAQYVYVPYQTPFLLSMRVTSTMVGTIIGAYGLSQLLLRMPIGIMADKRGRHKGFILIGIAASGIASVFRICFPDGTGFLIGNLLSGMASAMWISFMVLYSNYFEKNELQKAMGMIIAANNLGNLGAFVVSTFLYHALGMAFLCALSTGIAIPAFLLALTLKEPQAQIKPFSVPELVQVYQDKRLIFFSLLALAQQGVLMATCMSFTAQAAKLVGADARQIGLCYIVYIVAAVLSSYFAASSFARKQGAKFWIPAIAVCLAFYAAIIPNLPSVTWFYPVQILAGMSSGIMFSYCASEAMRDVPPGKKSTAMGCHQAIYALGMTAMPVITGTIAARAGLAGAFYVQAGVSLTAAIAAIAFYAPTKKARSHQSKFQSVKFKG